MIRPFRCSDERIVEILDAVFFRTGFLPSYQECREEGFHGNSNRFILIRAKWRQGKDVPKRNVSKFRDRTEDLGMSMEELRSRALAVREESLRMTLDAVSGVPVKLRWQKGNGR